MNNQVLDIIIPLIKASKYDEPIYQKENSYEFALGGTRYLLGQIIRQLWIPNEHKYISVAAKELWEKISNESISNYSYRSKVICTNKNKVTAYKYKNNGKNGEETELYDGICFTYNDIFHDEHMIPIADIIEKLYALDEPNYDNVSNVLNNLYTCIMLKDEDRKIYPKYHRSANSIDDIINGIYKKAEVYVLPLEQK